MKKNILYFISFIGIFLIVSLIINFSINSNSADIGKAYSETNLFENAIELANKNKSVIKEFGKIKEVDMLSIAEGNTIYTNNYNTVKSSVRIKSNTKSGKIDIYATKFDKDWLYEEIKIRIKNPKQEIYVISSDTIKK